MYIERNAVAAIAAERFPMPSATVRKRRRRGSRRWRGGHLGEWRIPEPRPIRM